MITLYQTANGLHSRIEAILESLDTTSPRMPPTALYNEGWLLRLILTAAEDGAPCLPFSFQPGSKWFSEALLPSIFLARRRGDLLAESCTHADGVVGHFTVGRTTKAGVDLDTHASQFVVCEAKMFSGLTAGTTRARGFDQAARNVACMATVLSCAGVSPETASCLGFYVLAPRQQIDRGVFASLVCKTSIRQRVEERIAAYEQEWRRSRLIPWFNDWFIPVLQRIHIECVAWELTIDRVFQHDPAVGSDLREFYSRCLRFNGPKSPVNI